MRPPWSAPAFTSASGATVGDFSFGARRAASRRLAELMQNRAAANPDRPWVDALRRAVDCVAGLTAVDGATVITDEYEVLAFGAKIVRREGSSQVAEVIALVVQLGALEEG